MSNDKKPTHNILHVEEFTNSNGEEKAFFTVIGKAWVKDNGTITCKIRDGLSVSGQFVMMPPKAKDDEQAES